MRAERLARALAGAAALVAFSLLLLLALLAAGGYDVGAAFRALVAGALGSADAITSGTLVRATPLLLTGLGVAIAFRAGIWNIGAEGQLLVGAAAAAAIALGLGARAGALALVLALAGGTAAGAVWAGVAALLRQRFGVLEVISTIMLNFVALYLVGWLVRGPLQEPLHIYPQSDTIAPAAQLPTLWSGTRLHWGFPLALLACVAAAFVVRATAAGFRLRAVGANPDAAHSAGLVDVARTTLAAFLVSGALAGAAGAVELTGVTYALYENISPGYGYTAIAVALLARLEPALVVASAILFGALEAGAAAMQRDAGVPSVIVNVVEAIIILTVLAVERLRVRAPEAA